MPKLDDLAQKIGSLEANSAYTSAGIAELKDDLRDIKSKLEKYLLSQESLIQNVNVIRENYAQIRYTQEDFAKRVVMLENYKLQVETIRKLLIASGIFNATTLATLGAHLFNLIN